MNIHIDRRFKAYTEHLETPIHILKFSIRYPMLKLD
jgi:hypothetical protein